MPPYVGIAILMRKFLLGICCKIAGGAHLSGLPHLCTVFRLFVLKIFVVRRLWGLLINSFAAYDFMLFI